MVNKGSPQSLSGIEKASILMMSLEEEVASKIFALMSEEEIKQISKTMSGLGKVDPTNVDELIGEFSEELGSGKSIVGDLSNAKKILTKALGADKVDDILGDMEGPMGKDTWDKLNNVSEELLASFLKNEHPQTVALILSRVRSSQAAKVLSVLGDDFSTEVIKRIISMEPVKREVVSEVEKVLQSEFMSTISSVKKVDSYKT